jgi:hypothetical protein
MDTYVDVELAAALNSTPPEMHYYVMPAKQLTLALKLLAISYLVVMAQLQD